MRFFPYDLPQQPVNGAGNTPLSNKLCNALFLVARALDNFIGGTASPAAALLPVTKVPAGLELGALCYVGDSNIPTTDYTKGYNCVYVGAGKVKYLSAIAKLPGGLTAGAQYWLDLDTGVITSTPNPASRLQLLGAALNSSDLHFLYSPPTA